MIALLIFIGAFALYTFTSGPYVVPYRDAGEMVTVLSTLGVAHPPGYPLYTLLGKIAVMFPAGSFFYRANLFSALCGAGALAMLFVVLRRLLSTPAAVASMLALALSNPFWELCSVSEMYALGVFWFGLLLWTAFVKRDLTLWAFCMGLALGVRMDMLLLIPLFAAWFYFASPEFRTPRRAAMGALGFGAGISLFLFLMFRSRTDPMMDWGNPDTLLGVFQSATRKSYSGTLDLLSLSYRSGENFLVNLQLYALHVVKSLGVLGALLSVAGFLASFKRQRALTLWFVSVFAITGPIFLYLANMPPNPHSIAIVEASYLIPDVILAIGIGFAIQSMLLWKPQWGKALFVVCLIGTIANAPRSFELACKRNNFYARDFVANVFRSVPSNSVAVFHKDVQLFSLWSAQLVERRRLDISLMSTGLSASPWFWAMHRRWGVAQSPEISLKDAAGWAAMKSALGDRPLVAGYDVEIPSDTGLQVNPHGFVAELAPVSRPFDADAARIFTSLALSRGRAVYGETPDFFSTDLIGDMARALHQTGLSALAHNVPLAAAFYFGWAEYLDPTFPRPPADNGYLSFTQGNFVAARSYYLRALHKSEDRLQLARDYKSLPEVLNTCLADVATMLNQLGAINEKLGDLKAARETYLRSLSIQESAQAHYNLAVTYWGRDWNLVISHMRRALELNPGMNEARMYLGKAMELSAKK